MRKIYNLFKERYKYISIFTMLLFVASTSNAQNCNDQFFDNGGSTGDYANNSNEITTICPDVAGDFVTVVFTFFEVETNWDALYVYDGNNISAPQIASANGATNGGFPAGGFSGTTVAAAPGGGSVTATGSTGCLTFEFLSDLSVPEGGWVADVLCPLTPPPACLTPTALTATNITNEDADLGWTSVETTFDVEFGEDGFTPTGTPTDAGVSNPLNVSGLDGSTDYVYYVRADCGVDGISDWAGPFSFTTLPNPPSCGGQFFDNGGSTGVYSANSNDVTTICPDLPGDVVTVTFTSFEVETNWDALYVFDGNSVAAPQIASTNGAANVPGGVAGGFYGTGVASAPGAGSVTSTDATGCLAFQFRSDASFNEAGWVADVTCAPPATPPACASGFDFSYDFTCSASEVEISFPPVADATTYNFSIGTAPGVYDLASGSTTVLPEVLFGSFDDNTTYYLLVVPVNAGVEAVGCTEISFTTPDVCPPPSCGGLYTDNGGVGGNYTASSNDTTTICPDVPGDVVTVTFTSFDTEGGWDALYVFNGNSTAAPQIASTNPTTSSGFPAGGFYGTGVASAPGAGSVTSTDATGCLTFQFRSDGSVSEAGWVADVTCAPPATPPGCASGLIFDYDETCSAFEVQISFPPVADATAYNFFLGTAPGVYDIANPFTNVNPEVFFNSFDDNTTYYLLVVPVNTGVEAVGCTEISFTTPDACPPPVNDECNDAIVVFGGYTITGFSTNFATGTDITSCVSGDDASVWFSYTPTCDVTVEVNTNGSTYDTGLSIFDDCSGTNELACDDDGGIGLQSLVSFAADSGVTYYIRIAGFAGATGDINFSVVETTSCPCIQNVWTGSADSDWSNDANWTCGVVPTSACGAGTDNAIIPAGASVTPVVTGTLGVGNLEISTGSSIVINGKLEVCGDLQHNGLPVTGAGDVELMGSVAQNISGSGTLNNLTLNNANGATVTTGSSLSLSTSLVLPNGSFTNNGNVTLLSSATTTAYLDDFSGTGTYVGDITVQRFVTAGSGLGQRLFGSAVQNGQIQGLDQTYANGANAGNTGYVEALSCSPIELALFTPYSNLFQWNEDAPFPTGCYQEGWFALPQTTPLESGRAYSGWMQDGTTLSITGAPNTGNTSFATTGVTAGLPLVDGWHALSNPFPSPLDISSVFSSGFTSPQIYDGASGPFEGTYLPALVGGDLLGIMQGFFAFSNTGSTFTALQSDRNSAANIQWLSGESPFTHMLEVSVISDDEKGDKTYLYYSSNTTEEFDVTGDCVKKDSELGRPTLYTSLEEEQMSLNGYAIEDIGRSIPMGLKAKFNGTHELTFEGMETFPANTTIYVEDKQEGIYHNVADGSYSFNASEEDAHDRFVIHFVPAIELVANPVSCDGTNGALTLANTDNTNRNYELLTSANDVVATGNVSSLTEELTAGMYNLNVYDAFGGLQTYEVEVEALPTIEAEFEASNVNVYINEQVNFNSMTQNATSLVWEVNGETIEGLGFLTYSFDEPGTYNVKLTASNGVCENTRMIEVNVKAKVSSIVELGEGTVQIYSTRNSINLKFDHVSDSKADVQVYNMLGQVMLVDEVETIGTQTLNVLNVSDGYYIVKLIQDGTMHSQKVLLTRK